MMRAKPEKGENEGAGADDRQFVTALARGLGVLAAFSTGGGSLTNGELARLTSLAPSTVSRLTHTLVRLGYLRLENQTQRYALTPKVLRLGYPVLAGTSLVERARPILKELSETTGETAALAIRDGLSVAYLDCVLGRNMLAVRMSVGSRLPLATSAAGLAILAAMGERERSGLVSRIRGEMARRDVDPAVFSQDLAAAQANPVALVRDRWQAGVGGVAMAIRDGQELGALVLPVATGAVTAAHMAGPLAAAVRLAANLFR